ncbi:MAG: histidine--tRNA ligase [Gemmatimonadota bacterium]
MQKGALPGFRDFYPEDLALRAHIFETWRRVATRYGFEEYDGPPLESLELYTAKSGDEIVGQLYAFTDKGEREVSLRPEMTPTLARMVAARANGLKKPIRWFSLPQLFRYERQQRGRLREHFQLNCDLIGEAGPLGDAEVIALAVDVMRAFGLTEKDVRVRLSDRRTLTALLHRAGVADAQVPLAFQAIDKAERMKREDLVAMLTPALDAATIDKVLAVAALKGLDAVRNALGPDAAAAEPLQRTVQALEAMGLGGFVDVDLTIVRGIAYYTGTVFELFDAGRTLRAICGGGRYDSLTGAMGGVELPAVGFGMGDVVLGELLKDRGLIPPYAGSIDVFVAAEGAETMPAALKLTHELRDAGVRAEYALGAQTISKQQDIAKARNARLMVVVGTAGSLEVQVKDLLGKSQDAVALTQAVSEIISRIRAS